MLRAAWLQGSWPSPQDSRGGAGAGGGGGGRGGFRVEGLGFRFQGL